MALSLPRIYTCSDEINGVNYVDINYSVLGLTNLPAITANPSVDVNTWISDKTTTTARINFSIKFIGTVNYTVIGFN